MLTNTLDQRYIECNPFLSHLDECIQLATHREDEAFEAYIANTADFGCLHTWLTTQAELKTLRKVKWSYLSVQTGNLARL